MDALTYTFKEICNKTGYRPSVVRYYEKEFKLNIPRDVNGRRIFTKIEFDKLLFIKELQEQGFTNGQIKRILFDGNNLNNSVEEVAATRDIMMPNALSVQSTAISSDNIIKFLDKKLEDINQNLQELNNNVTGKERDILISENMRLKMEIKQKAYEIIELKENLRFYKGTKKGFLSKLFKK